VFGTILVLFCLTAVPPAGAKKRMNRKAYLEWWKNEQLMAFFDCSNDQKEEIKNKLQRIEIEIWADQTELKKGKAQFRTHFLDPSVTNETIEKEWEDLVNRVRKRMEARKLEAHLYVRGLLKSSKFQELLELHPKFFEWSWFKKAPMKVFKGHVKNK
jgi:hypothetical protein